MWLCTTSMVWIGPSTVYREVAVACSGKKDDDDAYLEISDDDGDDDVDVLS